MIDTILFDLDGTLLPMDEDKFLKLYFKYLSVYFQDLIQPELLLKYVMKSTDEMIRTNNGLTNQTIFMNHFSKYIDGNIDIFENRFNEFYKTLFEEVKEATYPDRFMRKSVDILKEKGYQIVLATNPIFPLIANHKRINWAGFDPDEFAYISHFELNKYCKPNPEYYLEILDAIQKAPQGCLMVGNDVTDDLVSQKVGIKTYLITNHMINKKEEEIKSDYIGTYQDFYQFVQELPNICKSKEGII